MKKGTGRNRVGGGGSGLLSPHTTKLWRGYRVFLVRMYIRLCICSVIVITLSKRAHLLSNFDRTPHKFGYDNISNKYMFQGDGVKVKITDAIFFKKTLSSV